MSNCTQFEDAQGVGLPDFMDQPMKYFLTVSCVALIFMLLHTVCKYRLEIQNCAMFKACYVVMAFNLICLAFIAWLDPCYCKNLARFEN